MGAREGKSLSRQAAIPLKPGGSVISSSGLGDPGDNIKSDFSCVVHLCSSALQCQALLPPTLWLWHCHLNSLRVRGVCLVEIIDQAGWSTSIKPGKLLQGTSPFPLSLPCTGGTSGSSAGLLNMAVRVASSSVGSSVGATSSVDISAGASSSVGSSISCGVGETPNFSIWISSRSLVNGGCQGLHWDGHPGLSFWKPLLRGCTLHNGTVSEGHIQFHHQPQFLEHTPPKGMVSLALVD